MTTYVHGIRTKGSVASKRSAFDSVLYSQDLFVCNQPHSNVSVNTIDIYTGADTWQFWVTRALRELDFAYTSPFMAIIKPFIVVILSQVRQHLYLIEFCGCSCRIPPLGLSSFELGVALLNDFALLLNHIYMEINWFVILEKPKHYWMVTTYRFSLD